MCQEQNHSIKYEYYCKTHNKLCCCACVAKFKKKGNCQHTDCDVCTIEEIQDEKKGKLIENIKLLEDISLNFEQSISQLKIINEKISKNKEDIKMDVQSIFTKIRNAINEREDQLISEIDKKFEKAFFKENILKESLKLPNKIKESIEKGKKTNNKWDKNNLPSLINDCINIENSIKDINIIKESVEKFKDFESIIQFQKDENELMALLESIKKYGSINEKYQEFNFIFKDGINYWVTNSGKIASRNDGKYDFKCFIIGNKEIPKNAISRWKFKINSELKNQYILGIGPNNYNNEDDFYKNCWSFDCYERRLILKSTCYSDYANNKFSELLKKGDIIGIEVNRIKNTLSFSINDNNLGVACDNIPNDDSLYPIAILGDSDSSLEIIE